MNFNKGTILFLVIVFLLSILSFFMYSKTEDFQCPKGSAKAQASLSPGSRYTHISQCCNGGRNGVCK